MDLLLVSYNNHNTKPLFIHCEICTIVLNLTSAGDKSSFIHHH